MGWPRLAALGCVCCLLVGGCGGSASQSAKETGGSTPSGGKSEAGGKADAKDQKPKSSIRYDLTVQPTLKAVPLEKDGAYGELSLRFSGDKLWVARLASTAGSGGDIGTFSLDGEEVMPMTHVASMLSGASWDAFWYVVGDKLIQEDRDDTYSGTNREPAWYRQFYPELKKIQHPLDPAGRMMLKVVTTTEKYVYAVKMNPDELVVMDHTFQVKGKYPVPTVMDGFQVLSDDLILIGADFYSLGKKDFDWDSTGTKKRSLEGTTPYRVTKDPDGVLWGITTEGQLVAYDNSGARLGSAKPGEQKADPSRGGAVVAKADQISMAVIGQYKGKKHLLIYNYPKLK